MKTVLQLEEFAQLAAGIAGLYYQPVHLWWWLWIMLFFSPDISMLGYLVNTKVGAYAYNLFHHKAVAIAVAAAGFYLNYPVLLLAGILLFAHSCFDRAMGYGLKYTDAFKHTHLGWVRKDRAYK